MRNLICVVGRQGSGKTTICQSKLYHVLPGKLCREHFGDKFFVDKKNPSAPQESEKFVREIITSAISQLPVHETLWIDGFPRTAGQAEWLSGVCKEENIHCHIYVVNCNNTTRMMRLFNRDAENKDKSALVNVREQTEGSLLFDMLIDTTKNGFTWSIMNNDENVENPQVVDTLSNINTLTDLRKIWDLHIKLLSIGGYKFPNKIFQTEEAIIAGSERAKSIRDMFRHIIMECEEALEKIPDKSWPIPDLKTDVRLVRVELIDAFHFLLSAAMALGMDADFFAFLYNEKRKVNIKRQTEGYLKVRNGQDDKALGGLSKV